MGLIAAKCTACGANIEVDDTREAGICQYCGTAFITEKVINHYHTYVTNNNNFAGATIHIAGSDIDDLLELAKKELLLHNYTNANFYLDEIKKNGTDSNQKISHLFEELGLIEWTKASWKKGKEYKETKDLIYEITTYDSQNVNVWLAMMEMTDWAGEVIEYGNNVILLAPQDQKEYYKEKVYELFLKREFDDKKISTTDNLVSEIPHDYIMENDRFQSMLCEYCVKYISVKPISIIMAYEKRINAWCDQLQSDKRTEIEKMIKDRHSGCYIATCVYGSYDCPQVLTLRKFRDNTLKKTWYGRMFVKCYYAISPTLVNWFGETKWFRSFWKSRLDKMIAALNSKSTDDLF